MEWKFWNRKKVAADKNGETKLAKPRELPQQIGQYLVLQEQMDPDYVWALRCVLRPYPDVRTKFDFLVFSTRAVRSAGIDVSNYDHLAKYPDLILYRGWFDKRTNEIEVHKATKKAA